MNTVYTEKELVKAMIKSSIESILTDKNITEKEVNKWLKENSYEKTSFIEEPEGVFYYLDSLWFFRVIDNVKGSSRHYYGYSTLISSIYEKLNALTDKEKEEVIEDLYNKKFNVKDKFKDYVLKDFKNYINEMNCD